MSNKSLHQLKKEYDDIPIPKELDFVVKKAFKDSEVYSQKKKYLFRRTSTAAASIAALAVILTIGINTSPVFAATLSKIPVMGNVVKVLTFREYIINEENHNANIKIPSIQGLNNKEIEKSLNEKYLEENKKLYEEFIEDMEELKKMGDGHTGIDSGYEVKTDNETILSVGRYVVNTAASSSTTFKYDTIDKKKEVLITLPSLFKDKSYIEIISDNIKKQMIQQMKSDPDKIYWVSYEGGEEVIDAFEKILEHQSFYVNSESKLVISFNKYEVAPGYMGVVEFTIPTDIISDILVGNEYIK